MDGAWGKGIALSVDVQGLNYHLPDLDAFHAGWPRRPSLGTEVASSYATRGIYAEDRARGYVSAYDGNRPRHGSGAEEWWKVYSARPWIAGGFAWTGFDYRGEPSPYEWPCISSHFGIMDTCGFPKDSYYYYRAWWGDRPVLHLFPHWNWPGKEGQPIEVWCHSNLDEVELLLNGTRVGSQEVPRQGHVAWKVPYQPGRLEARGRQAGKPLLVAVRETTDRPARLLASADRPRIAADGEDVSVVAVQVADGQGRVVPMADNPITFRLSGPGALIGVGNGDPSSHEPDKASARRAFNGWCAAIVQATTDPGELRLEASSPGLQATVVVIRCAPATPRPRA
jgi:beta-galactosidase